MHFFQYLLFLGKQGVYVTLKGQKIIDSVDSKLPRVTGVSLPKIQKPRDYVDEMLFVNQPPPTPVETSIVTFDKHKPETNPDGRSIHQIEEQTGEEDAQHNEPPKDIENAGEKEGEENVEIKEEPVSQVVESENVITEKKSLEIGPAKKVNFEDLKTEEPDKNDIKTDNVKEKENVNENKDNVVFFMTEENKAEEKDKNVKENNIKTENSESTEIKDSEKERKPDGKEIGESESVEEVNEAEEQKTVEDVIKVEISETEKKTEDAKPETDIEDEGEKPITSNDYPFDGSND